MEHARRRGLGRGPEATFVRADRRLGPLPACTRAEARRESPRALPALVRTGRQRGLRPVARVATARTDRRGAGRGGGGGPGRWAPAVGAGAGRGGGGAGRRGRPTAVQAAQAVQAVRLLPALDTYVLGHANRDHLTGTTWWTSTGEGVPDGGLGVPDGAGRRTGSWARGVANGRVAVRVGALSSCWRAGRGREWRRRRSGRVGSSAGGPSSILDGLSRGGGGTADALASGASGGNPRGGSNPLRRTSAESEFRPTLREPLGG
jgi:hypothetical protein